MRQDTQGTQPSLDYSECAKVDTELMRVKMVTAVMTAIRKQVHFRALNDTEYKVNCNQKEHCVEEI